MLRYFPFCLERDLMLASRALSRLVMMGLPFQRHFLFTIGAVAVFGTASAVVIEDVVCLDTHRIDPSLPVFRQRRCLCQFCIPRIGLLSVTALQFSVAHSQLEPQNCPIRIFLIRGQILKNLYGVFVADPYPT